MFMWFKNKIELKKDNSLMSSFCAKKGIKLGSEIVVPNNFELLVFYKEKLFATLTNGKYKLDKKHFEDLINCQQKNKPKLKHIKGVFHYINLSEQTLKFKFKKQYFTVTFKIINSLNFASLLLLHTYKVDNDYTLSLISEVFHELLLYNKGNYKNITNDCLNDFGISIINFSISTDKHSLFLNHNKSSESNKSNVDALAIEPSKNSNIEEEAMVNKFNEVAIKQQSEMQNQNNSNLNNNPHLYTCPKCNNTSKFSTTYCLKCGYKLQ